MTYMIKINESYLSYFNNVGLYWSDSQVDAYRFSQYWAAAYLKQVIQYTQREQARIVEMGAV